MLGGAPTSVLRPRAGAAALALLVVLALPQPALALRWRACRDVSDARCTGVRVALDRSGTEPGTIRLRVARTGRRSGPTLMYLSGGPGGAGVTEMLGVISTVPKLARHYRVIGFDQRGTGRSGLLRCPELEHDPRLRSTRAAADCARRLGPARRHYTTADSVADMEAIRRALGVQRLTLFGISYGTELAIEYARAHPDHVARLAIDSVVDPDDRDPFFLTGFRAMPPSLRALCPNGCRGISADPAADLAALVAKLRRRPLRGTAYDRHGRPHRVRIGPTTLYDLMFDTDYWPPIRAALPAAVRAALHRDGAPVARLVREASVFTDLGKPSEFSSARYATICEETPLPWDPGTPFSRRRAVAEQRADALGASAFYPFDPPTSLEDEIDLCLRWPGVPRPGPGVDTRPYPAPPTLILQGGEDLRTPPEGSARVAARIAGARRLVVPGVGHAVTGDDPSDCGTRALVRFLTGDAAGVPATCRRVPTLVPGVLAPPASFAALPTVPGLPRRIGRTLAGIAATLDDLRLVLSPATLANAGGGLRGGWWAIEGNRLVLHAFEAVHGLTLGANGGGRRLRLRVGGSRAAHGAIVLRSGGRFSGTLGGRRLSGVLGTSEAPPASGAAARWGVAGRASALARRRSALALPLAAVRRPRPAVRVR